MEKRVLAVILLLLLVGCVPATGRPETSATAAFAQQVSSTAVESGVGREEQVTSTSTLPTMMPSSSPATTPTIEPTATLTPYQVWEATCLTEGAQYIEVPFGLQEDGRPGILALEQVIDGSFFVPEAVPDCYMFGSEFTSPMTQTRAVAWQLAPDQPEPPKSGELTDFTLPRGTARLLLKNMADDGIQDVLLPSTPDPRFKLVSPFQACDGDITPVMWGDGSFNAVFDGDCMGSGMDNQGWGHTDIMAPVTCIQQEGYGVFVAPASGIVLTYECHNLLRGVDEKCFELHIDNAQYLIGLHEAFAFTGMPEKEIDGYINEITGPNVSWGGVSLQIGHVQLYPGIAGQHVEAGQPIGETVWNGTDKQRAAIHVYTQHPSEDQYQLSVANFPFQNGVEFVPYPLDILPNLAGGAYDFMGGTPVANNVAPWCKDK